MLIQHIGFRIPGFYTVASFATKEQQMSHIAQQKRDALIFWERHGLNATLDHTGVSRATLYAWRKDFQARGLGGLADRTRASHHRRRRNWPVAVIKRIRSLRQRYPNLGPNKVFIHLKPWCEARGLNYPSARTIGRLIADAPDRMRHSPVRLTPKGRRKPVKRKPRPRLGRDLRCEVPGECVAFDTVIRYVDGCRRYLFTAIDHHSRFAFALAVPRANSASAARFAELVQAVFPGHIRQVLSDNGSEFQGAFADYTQEQGWRHCYTYPRCPKMNAYVERFNRTLQEEFVDYEEELLLTDRAGFNDQLLSYLERYNGERPHWGLGYLTPCQALARAIPDLSRIGWHQTAVYLYQPLVVKWLPQIQPP